MKLDGIELVKISIEEDGVGVQFRMPKFKEDDTEECKRDMEELKELTTELGNKVAAALDKYTPKREIDSRISDDLAKALEALSRVVRTM